MRPVGEPITIVASDDAAFLDGRMLDECVLDLDRTHPQSSDLEHVVGSTRIAEIAGLILRVLVAGPQPLALEGSFDLSCWFQ
jgi:hypothetical protein